MRREEILNMEPGRAMDELVMTTIFEARRAYYGEDELWYRYDENGKPDYEWSAYNSPSTDISAAWEVLDKFKTHQVTFHENGFYQQSDMKYRVIIAKNQHASYANTAPEAICKAALLAVMDKEAEAK